MEFTPVPLVSPKGRPWLARTAAELVNLTSKGYRPAPPEPTPEVEPLTDYASGGWLPPGLQTVYNGTSEPETVLSKDDVEHLDGELPA